MIIDSLIEEPLISIRQISELAAMTTSPCISIYLSKYSPENDSIPFGVQLQTALQRARQKLASHNYPEDELPLEQIHEFAKQRRWEKERCHLAMFCTRNWARIFRTSYAAPESVHVGNEFHILSLLSALTSHPQFAILALSEKHVRLLRCNQIGATEVDLPPSLPRSVKEAGAFEQPDHDLENRSAAGSSPGSLRRIHFGTGTDEEKAEEYLANFFRIIDREITHIYQGEKLPLIVAAVERELALYTKVSCYPELLPRGIQGSPERVSSSELHQAALKVLDNVAADEEARLLAGLTERQSSDLMLTDVPAMMDAASCGRIRILIVNGTAGFVREDETLNLIALETLRHDGEVKMFKHQSLPSHSSALAILRYNVFVPGATSHQAELQTQ